ncbi:hypothetical protein SALB1_3396 [Salinisphaera sp. LB1]|nr:hypothetical protein SALB1_3396 [Salinisphaera sp. LB1]
MPAGDFYFTHVFLPGFLLSETKKRPARASRGALWRSSENDRALSDADQDPE